MNIISFAVHFRSAPPKALLSKAVHLLGALNWRWSRRGIGPSSNVEGNKPPSLAFRPQFPELVL